MIGKETRANTGRYQELRSEQIEYVRKEERGNERTIRRN